MTDVPPTITYASVVSHSTMMIALKMVIVNDMIVKTSGIINAYIRVPCGEKVYTILGTDFGPDEGKMMIIVRALYGFKSVRSSFRNHLARCMQYMVYKPCLDDPDLCIRPMKRSRNGFKHYE